MKEHETKALENLVAKAMQKSTLETPSFQFTDKVMTAINAEQKSVSFRYHPLIPKYIWIVIAATVVGITGYLWFSLQPEPLDLPTPSFNFMDSLSPAKIMPAFTPSRF